MNKFILLFVKLIPNWIKPNHLSITRAILLLPVIVFLYFGQKFVALAIFLLAVFLDVLDGYLARARNQTTKSGEWLDPFADKLLILGIIFLYGLPYFPIWIIVPMIFLEFFLVFGRPIKVKLGISAKANKWGKVKMTFQSLGITTLIIDANFLRPIFISFFIGAILFAALSIFFHLKEIIESKK